MILIPVKNLAQAKQRLADVLDQPARTELAQVMLFDVLDAVGTNIRIDARGPEVLRVLYPALESDPGHALWKRDFAGSSGLFSVVLKPVSANAVAAMLDGLELFGLGTDVAGVGDEAGTTVMEDLIGGKFDELIGAGGGTRARLKTSDISSTLSPPTR